MSVEDESGSSAVALAVKTVVKKAAPASVSAVQVAKKAKLPPEPELKTVKKVTSAAKPKPEPKQAAKAAPKPAAKPAAKAAEVPAPKPEPKPAPKPAAKLAPVAAAPVAAAPAAAASAAATLAAPAPAAAAKPMPKPAAAPAVATQAPAPPAAAPTPPPQSHSGVISGPMRPMTPPRAMAKAEIFVDGDFVVYPTHGVGKVERIATEEIAGHTLELIHITFDENRMTLRVPTNKARTAGLRKLASRKQFDDVLATLKGRARIKRTMWSRRAQEYEAKINSGDPQSIAEVVRDLHRNAGQPDQSFSERQIYESALDRLAAEYGALEQVDKATATERLIAHLKSE
jgi:CarD family transcriptional regulator